VSHKINTPTLLSNTQLFRWNFNDIIILSEINISGLGGHFDISGWLKTVRVGMLESTGLSVVPDS